MKINNPSAPPTKELFIPATGQSTGLAPSLKGDFPGFASGANGSRARVTFKVPHDFGNIVEARLVIIPIVTQAVAEISIVSDYGSIGQPYTTHSGQDAASTYDLTANELFGIDASGILTDLVAGDFVGICTQVRNAVHTYHLLGFYLRYA